VGKLYDFTCVSNLCLKPLSYELHKKVYLLYLNSTELSNFTSLGGYLARET
jgi:hypothetical protein